MLPVKSLNKAFDGLFFYPTAECRSVSPNSPQRMRAMKSGEMDWNEVEKVGIGALIASSIASLYAYFRSIGQKANKAEVEKQLSEMRAEIEKQLDVINRRHSLWETRSERFATREMVDALNAKIERLDTRLDAHFEKINVRLDKFIEGQR